MNKGLKATIESILFEDNDGWLRVTYPGSPTTAVEFTDDGEANMRIVTALSNKVQYYNDYQDVTWYYYYVFRKAS
ncbi:MAG: hypothetical protein IJR10_05025 [Clostridia bacterium]|nr:hypothetical protein [Clostridia bacterium]